MKWFKVTDGELQSVTEDDKYHVEDYDTTYCMEVKSIDDVDAGVYIVKAQNKAGDVEAEFKLDVESKLDLSSDLSFYAALSPCPLMCSASYNECL